MKNYYEVIGVSANATKDQIRKTYYKKLKMYHPDVFQGDEEICKQITEELNQAYQVLRDSEQRKILDKEYGNYKYKEPKPEKEKVERHIFKDLSAKIKSWFKSKPKKEKVKKEKVKKEKIRKEPKNKDSFEHNPSEEQNTCKANKSECVIEMKRPRDLTVLNYFIYGFCALMLILIVVFFIV